MKDKKYLVQEDDLLLEFLLKNVAGSKNNIKNLLSNRQIEVNNKVITQYDYSLKSGDEIKVVSYLKSQFSLPILYEDDWIIIIDKPSGLLSVATEKEKEKTAFKLVMEYVKKVDNNNKVFIVHRLDKDTSGILILAKSYHVKKMLQNNWSNYQKQYYGIVEGKLDEEQGTLKSYLVEDKFLNVYSSSNKKGVLAISEYQVIKSNSRFSLIKINLITGRKNQIRVQFSDLKRPIVGDKKYSSTIDPLKRLALHCFYLKLFHPMTAKPLQITTAIPEIFKKII